MTHSILTEDVLVALRGLPDGWFDALLTDPPYGIRFMGSTWDYQVPSVEVWRECLRVLKSGAPILSYGGRRTFHRVWCGIEDAGFELFDTIMWIYSQGMPKPIQKTDGFIDQHLGARRSKVARVGVDGYVRNGEGVGLSGAGSAASKRSDEPISAEAKRWADYGQALAPAHEPIALACKPFDGSIAENIMAHDVGGLNVGACRVSNAGKPPWVFDGRVPSVDRSSYQLGSAVGGAYRDSVAGRWPKNVILSHSPDCVKTGTREVRTGTAVKSGKATSGGTGASISKKHREGAPDITYGVNGKETIDTWDCIPDCPIRLMDEQSGERPSTLSGRADPSSRHANPGDNGGKSTFGGGNSAVYADFGGASRFFYHAKVTREERELGCEHLPIRNVKSAPGEVEEGVRNFHPTLKPIRLNRYLATLLLPPPRDGGRPRRLLVPFAGAGSEVIGALRAGWDDVIGIEREAEFVAIAEARIARWEEARRSRPEFSEADVVASNVKVDPRQRGLFGG